MVNLDSKKLGDILKFLIAVVAALLLNALAARHYWRFDLTQEKRYSVSEATKNLLKDLEDEVFVEVYLAGDLPSDFERFRKSIRETLEQFRAYAGANFQYTFVDPLQARSEKARNEAVLRLGQMGVQPTNLHATVNGERIEKLVFPGVVIYHGDQSKGVTLLKGNQGAASREILNQSIEGLEYELGSTIRSLAGHERKTIGLLKGHGELDSLHAAGLKTALQERYRVAGVFSNNLDRCDAVIVAKPREPFSDRDIFFLDQYLMHGGKVMFLLDGVEIDMEEVGGEGTTAVPVDLNLTDLLFQYGVRMGHNVVMDLNSALYPVITGNIGDQPQVRPMPWPYFPLVNAYADHPVVKNLDATILKFAGVIDTVKADGIRKTPLFFTSPYSRIVQAPFLVSLNQIRSGFKPEDFNHGPQPLAYLLEGSFASLYKNRILPPYADENAFVGQSKPTKIIICGDGDLVRNEIGRNGKPYPLGFDPVMQATLANRDFILNALSYMLDEDGLIVARNKEVMIRPLDKVRVQEHKTSWQTFNLTFPVLVVILFGLAKFYIRKRKYARF